MIQERQAGIDIMEINLSLIITLIIGAVGTLLWYLITRQIDSMEKATLERKKELDEYKAEQKRDFEQYRKEEDEKHRELWKEMREFKMNYLDRFEKVNTNINSSRETILDMIHQIDKKIKT